MTALGRWYEVLTPEFCTDHGDLGSGGYDPPEYGRDFVPVYARSAKRAIALAVSYWRRRAKRDRRTNYYVNADPDLSPFRGITAKRMDCEAIRHDIGSEESE